MKPVVKKTLLAEASTLSRLLGKNPKSKDFLEILHGNFGIPIDAEIENITNYATHAAPITANPSYRDLTSYVNSQLGLPKDSEEAFIVKTTNGYAFISGEFWVVPNTPEIREFLSPYRSVSISKLSPSTVSNALNTVIVYKDYLIGGLQLSPRIFDRLSDKLAIYRITFFQKSRIDFLKRNLYKSNLQQAKTTQTQLINFLTKRYQPMFDRLLSQAIELHTRKINKQVKIGNVEASRQTLKRLKTLYQAKERMEDKVGIDTMLSIPIHKALQDTIEDISERVPDAQKRELESYRKYDLLSKMINQGNNQVISIFYYYLKREILSQLEVESTEAFAYEVPESVNTQSLTEATALNSILKDIPNKKQFVKGAYKNLKLPNSEAGFKQLNPAANPNWLEDWFYGRNVAIGFLTVSKNGGVGVFSNPELTTDKPTIYILTASGEEKIYNLISNPEKALDLIQDSLGPIEKVWGIKDTGLSKKLMKRKNISVMSHSELEDKIKRKLMAFINPTLELIKKETKNRLAKAVKNNSFQIANSYMGRLYIIQNLEGKVYEDDFFLRHLIVDSIHGVLADYNDENPELDTYGQQLRQLMIDIESDNKKTWAKLIFHLKEVLRRDASGR